MKKLTFEKNTILELNETSLGQINGGTGTNPTHQNYAHMSITSNVSFPGPGPASNTTTSGAICINVSVG